MLQRRNYIERTPFVEKPNEIGSHGWLVASLDEQVRRIGRRLYLKYFTPCDSFTP